MSELLKKFDIKQTIEDIKTLFEYFNGDTIVFFILFIISVIYIWKTEKNKKTKDLFTWYVCLILIIIWNPICVKILNKFINFTSMYRLYYLLPINITIAVAATRFIENRKKMIYKLISLVAVLVIIVYFGNCIFDETSTIKTNNYYKLPDETVAVAEIIYNDDKFEEKRAVVPYGMSSQINQIYADIYLPYTRVVTNSGAATGEKLPADTDDASRYEPVINLDNGNVEYLGEFSKKHNLNYIVVSKNVVLTAPIENIGFEYYKETEEHIIYRKIEK